MTLGNDINWNIKFRKMKKKTYKLTQKWQGNETLGRGVFWMIKRPLNWSMTPSILSSKTILASLHGAKVKWDFAANIAIKTCFPTPSHPSQVSWRSSQSPLSNMARRRALCCAPPETGKPPRGFSPKSCLLRVSHCISLFPPWTLSSCVCCKLSPVVK